jgi:hypothetical protein
MGVLFNGTQATNGFNRDGHYVRTDVLVGSCTGYSRSPVPGCSARFPGAKASAAVARQAVRRTHTQTSGARLTGLLHYLVGSSG